MKNIKNKFYIIILLFINLKINSAENDITNATLSIFKNIFTKDLTGLINTASILGITSALKSNSKETFYGVALGAGATCGYYSLKYIPIFLKERKIQKEFANHLNLEKEIINNKNNENGILLNFIKQEINDNTDFYEIVKNDKTLAFTNIYNNNIENNNLNIKNLNNIIDARKKLLEGMPNSYNFYNLEKFYDKQYYENIIKILCANYKLEEQRELNKNSDKEELIKHLKNEKQDTSIQIINQQFNFPENCNIIITQESLSDLEQKIIDSKKRTKELTKNFLELSKTYEQK